MEACILTFRFGAYMSAYTIHVPGLLLTLAIKHMRRVTANCLAFVHPSVCSFVHLSVCPNPPVLNDKGHLRESMHSRYTRHKGRVVMLSSAQWCSSVQLLHQPWLHD